LLRATGVTLPRSLPRSLPQSDIHSIALDALTVVDDNGFLDLVTEEELNLPTFIGPRLRSLYG
jgi:hypothetical protein